MILIHFKIDIYSATQIKKESESRIGNLPEVGLEVSIGQNFGIVRRQYGKRNELFLYLNISHYTTILDLLVHVTLRHNICYNKSFKKVISQNF